MSYKCPKCGEQVYFFIEQTIEYKRLVNVETGKLETETKTNIKKSGYLFDDSGVRCSNRDCDWS
ncbi:hypothetical protein Xmau_03790 [Xenorhabdus mauleonii]|uniref:Uncharacterized protein n=1 Tax=Xenorhabdus mauleonii TaxID=351675 RepID=A0A1I3VA83_9GAMM|nr:hypothetical protein [Xenorhabdus mauleonii]PHM37574.1 hypothetical protein Xmau_03790 [Xenorhabdus mauleonii]SFJ91117.1 hypothetical protein SAMN05421680_11980 [Xenorhabdus mauleonii]